MQPTSSFPLPLKDYSLTAEEGSIYIEYEATRLDGEPGEVTNFFINLRELAFSYAEGYLGNVIFEGGRDTIAIDFFQDWIEGDIYFSEPKITYYLQNSFGLPTRSMINVLEVITVGGEILPLESDVVGPGQGIDFLYPGLDEVGESKTSVFVFDKTNSNIDEIVSAGPLAIDYEINALTNPDNDPSVRGFITDTSFYNVRMEVDLPFYGQASNFIALDTIEINFDNWQQVDAAEFKIVAENSAPLDVVIQGYFIEPSGFVLDSLLNGPQRLITGAPVDSNGDVTQIATETSYAPFSVERFDRIKYADRIIIEANFSTTNNGNELVRVYSDQDVKVRVGAKFEIGN